MGAFARRDTGARRDARGGTHLAVSESVDLGLELRHVARGGGGRRVAPVEARVYERSGHASLLRRGDERIEMLLV